MDSPNPEAADSIPAPLPGGSATMGAAAQRAGDTIAAEAEKTGLPIKKLVIAIHGIGDQYRQATIQTVVTQFGRHFGVPASVPLGSFYSRLGKVAAFTLKAPPEPPESLAGIGFLEAYWANIPRRIQQRGYTIEESKAWARTIVERIRARYAPEIETAYDFTAPDFLAAAAVLEEMVDTIAVLGNLLFLAEKAGILQFDLDTLLTSYLGDVQVVADFANYRARIVAQFHEVLAPVYDAVRTPECDPEIYIIAHSEGTVVAFMALLQAMCGQTEGEEAPPARPAWIERVRGLMTIGSPIDKHLIFWPAIWDAVQTPGQAPAAGPIKWRNYYDFGDPVGFELDTARAWLSDPQHNWDAIGAFEFTKEDDFGFSRYFLPGAAHNDYWTDDGVFGHFIQNVMELPPPPELGEDYSEPPDDNRWAKVSSYVLPYVLVFGILLSGVYLLFKAMREFLADEAIVRWPTEDCWLVRGMRHYFHHPTGASSALLDVIFNVLGMTCLLAGMTLLARIPRLTRRPLWLGIAVALFVAFGALYFGLVDIPRRCWLGFHPFDKTFRAGDEIAPTVITLVLTFATGCLAIVGGRCRAPAWLQWALHGMRPLLIPGFLTVLFIVAFRLTHGELAPVPAPSAVPVAAATQSLWPLLLGGAAFAYLWWLAALIFDLVFVWHRYIRFSVLQQQLGAMRPERKAREAREKKAQEERLRAKQP